MWRVIPVTLPTLCKVTAHAQTHTFVNVQKSLRTQKKRGVHVHGVFYCWLVGRVSVSLLQRFLSPCVTSLPHRFSATPP